VKSKKKNYYKALNLRQNASESEIKKAYRSAAKKYHPDTSAKNGEKFKQIQEAYETLSDSDKKSAYDQELRSGHTPHQRIPSSSKRHEFTFDLFDPFDPLSAWSDFWSDFVSDSFLGVFPQQRRRHVEIVLTPEEARLGGKISLDIPLETPCSRCRGTGRVGRLICGFCRGQGPERSEKRLTLSIPPGVRHGTEVRIPLDDWKMGDLELVATVYVDG
jgi:DnaJ-class molecular chaperone